MKTVWMLKVLKLIRMVSCNGIRKSSDFNQAPKIVNIAKYFAALILLMRLVYDDVWLTMIMHRFSNHMRIVLWTPSILP